MSEVQVAPAILVPISEAMRLLGVRRTTINKLMRERKIERRHIGRRTVVPMESIKKYAESLKQ